MTALHTAPTDALSAGFLGEIRTLLEAAFAGAFDDDDWRHALGGIHVWLTVEGRIAAHASVVPRMLTCSGTVVQTGYVEAVAVMPPHRRQGYGRAVMVRAGEVIRASDALGALSTGSHAFYERLGWERWRGPTFVDGAAGARRTPDDDGGIMILRTVRSPILDLDREIMCDWRSGDVW